MRTLPVLLAAALSGAGCADALGPAGGCAAEMAQTRVLYGSPSDVDEAQESSGEFVETWIYQPEGDRPGRFVEFRWGTNLGECIVETATFDVEPVLPYLTSAVPGDG